MATAIKVGAMGGKPEELRRIVHLLVHGAGDEKGDDQTDSEYVDDQWWTVDGDPEIGNGDRRDDP